MDIICPHCGTEYDAEEGEYGRFVKCEICGNGFVAGASIAKRVVMDSDVASTSHGSTDHNRRGNGAMRQTGKLTCLMKARISHAPWQIQFLSCYYVVYGIAMSIAAGIWGLVDRNFPDMLFSPLPAVFLGLMTTLFLSYRWMYWLIISFGVIAFVICVLGGVTMFSIGLVICAIMLLQQPCRRWNLLREKREKSVSLGTAKKVAIAAALLAIISAIVSFAAMEKEIQDAREHFESPLVDLPKDKGRAAYVYLLRQKRENKAAARNRYRKLLDIGNLRELYFVDGSNKDGVYYLNLEGPGGAICSIQWHFSPDGNHYFEWPSMIPRDFALEMMRLRLEISLP